MFPVPYSPSQITLSFRGKHSVLLDDLQSFTTYEIRVAGLTQRGEGVYSQAMYQGNEVYNLVQY